MLIAIMCIQVITVFSPCSDRSEQGISCARLWKLHKGNDESDYRTDLEVERKTCPHIEVCDIESTVSQNQV